VHLRFDIPASSLPADIKARLLECRDRRISGDGVLVIKAQRHRTQERNLEDARERLRELVLAAIHVPKTRKATRPTRAAHVRRLAAKAHRARVKILRGRTDD
jgi:ribosome-associated protein